MKARELILVFIFVPLLSNGQVLLDQLDNVRHIQVADLYKANNIKRVYYTIHFPKYWSIGTTSDGRQDSTAASIDTITFSRSYLKNGLIENEKQTLPNGDIYYLKEYLFDST